MPTLVTPRPARPERRKSRRRRLRAEEPSDASTVIGRFGVGTTLYPGAPALHPRFVILESPKVGSWRPPTGPDATQVIPHGYLMR
jgi:hypothetical protein